MPGFLLYMTLTLQTFIWLDQLLCSSFFLDECSFLVSVSYILLHTFVLCVCSLSRRRTACQWCGIAASTCGLCLASKIQRPEKNRKKKTWKNCSCIVMQDNTTSRKKKTENKTWKNCRFITMQGIRMARKTITPSPLMTVSSTIFEARVICPGMHCWGFFSTFFKKSKTEVTTSVQGNKSKQHKRLKMNAF